MPVIQKLKFFQDKLTLLTRRDLLEIIMNMRYQFKEAGETVFYQGDVGEEYFIILRGRVQISVIEVDQTQCEKIVCQDHPDIVQNRDKRTTRQGSPDLEEDGPTLVKPTAEEKAGT